MRWRGWFGPKVIGYGIGPRRWQGWAVSALLIAAIIGSRFLHPQVWGLPPWARPAIVAVLGLAFVLVVFATYDPDA